MSAKQKRIIWPVLFVVATIVVAVAFASTRSGYGALSNASSTANPPAPNTTAVAVAKDGDAGAITASGQRGTSARGPVQNIRFTIYDAGVYPQETHVGKGLIAVSIEDLSGASAGLVIERSNGNDHARIGLVRRLARHFRGKSEMVLTPGQYNVYDLGHPEQRSSLMVEP